MTVAGRRVIMLSVAAIGPEDAWAIGVAAPIGAGHSRLVIEHQTRRGWRRVSVPAKVLSPFYGRITLSATITASSASNVWAFNQLTGAWLQWNGHRWSEGRLRDSPGTTTAITSALALAKDNVWAFGGKVDRKGNVSPLAAHFNGRMWVTTALPGKLQLPVSAASSISPHDIWAVIGQGGQIVAPPGPAGGEMVHWNGVKWQLIPLPKSLGRRGDPTSIDALSDHNVWIGGGTTNAKLGLTESAAHWNGVTWKVARLRVTPSAADCALSSIVGSRNESAEGLTVCFSDRQPFTLSRFWRFTSSHWVGPSTFHLAKKPPVILNMASAGMSTRLWAVGYAGSDGIIVQSEQSGFSAPTAPTATPAPRRRAG